MLQNEALDIMKMGHNVYLTGPAGSGKTFVLNEYIKYLRENNIVVGVTASTGIAATHMNGMTIHSWAGLGISEIGPQDIKRIAAKPVINKRITETKVLIIDEVSMLDGYGLDAVDAITREIKDNSKPFGGLQVILSGDLFQLPPVTKNGEPFFVFKSDAWNNMNLKICYLEEQHRQEYSNLLEVLNAIRSNTVEEAHFEYLSARINAEPKDKNIIKLYSHNAHVDDINFTELDKLQTESRIYYMTSKGRKSAVESLISKCLAPEELELKVGSKVMFVANNPQKQFVNGTLGLVIDFDDDDMPIIKTKDRVIIAEQHTWKTEDGDKVIAEVTQLPLRLAWAITIHKSQGMSLDAAEIDLSKSFEPGMGYVALSRVRSIDGLYIKGINNMAMVVNPQIIELDVRLRTKSAMTKSELGNIDSSKIKNHHNTVLLALRPEEEKLLDDYDEKLYEKLKDWRLKQSIKQSAPAYVILPDKTLKLIASILPEDEKQLSQISGIGPQKLEKYSKEILKLLASS